MKKSVWIFLLAVFLPGAVLGWLALRGVEEQQIVFERRTAELYQKETDALAAGVREAVEAERRAFGDAVHRLLARNDPKALAADFTNSLADVWPRSAVGFALDASGSMLSPTTKAAANSPDLRNFIWDNGGWLCSTQPAVVYRVPIDQNKFAANPTQDRQRLNATVSGKLLAQNSKDKETLAFSANRGQYGEISSEQTLATKPLPSKGIAEKNLEDPATHAELSDRVESKFGVKPKGTEALARPAPSPTEMQPAPTTSRPTEFSRGEVPAKKPAIIEGLAETNLEAPARDAKVKGQIESKVSEKAEGKEPFAQPGTATVEMLPAPPESRPHPLAPSAPAAPQPSAPIPEPVVATQFFESGNAKLALDDTKKTAKAAPQVGTAIRGIRKRESTSDDAPSLEKERWSGNASPQRFDTGGAAGVPKSAPVDAPMPLKEAGGLGPNSALSQTKSDEVVAGGSSLRPLGRRENAIAGANPPATAEAIERLLPGKPAPNPTPGAQSISGVQTGSAIGQTLNAQQGQEDNQTINEGEAAQNPQWNYTSRNVEPIQVFNAPSQAISNIMPDTAEFRMITAMADEGMVSRFVQDQLDLIFWMRPPEAPDLVFGCLIKAASLKEIWPALIRQCVSEGSREQPPFVLALLDDRAKPAALHPISAGPREWKLPFVASEIGEALPHWEATLYLPTPNTLAENARGFRRTLSFTVVAALGIILIGAWLVVADIRREFARAQQKTDFVSNVSHELKTPLTSIRMFAELMHDRPPPPEKQGQYLRIITVEAERLTRLINNVLDFAKLERRQRRFDKRPLDLHAVISRVWEGQEMHLRNAGFTTRWQAAPPPYPVVGDEDALSQIVVNLLSNAEKYSRDQKEVELHTWSEDGWLCLSVLDRGMGVPAGEERKIFESFYRAHDSLSSGIQGSGLGLTLAQRVAEEHGGKIEFTRRDGGGSRFTLRLPLAPGSGTAADFPSASQLPPA